MSYDARGNLMLDEGVDECTLDHFRYSYDLENRLTKVEYEYQPGAGFSVLAEYRYDGLGRRIEFVNHGAGMERTTRYYYDGQNVIAEYNPSDELQQAYFHGTQYVDERAVMRSYEAAVAEDRYYVLRELYTVAGLAGANGKLEEMYEYDAYGQVMVHVWPVGDVDNDGAVTDTGGPGVDDYDIVAACITAGIGVEPLADVNLDGSTDAADAALVRTIAASGSKYAEWLPYSPVNNWYLFTGRLTDAMEIDNKDGLYYRWLQDNRNRTYDLRHGRWLQRDPFGFRLTEFAPDGQPFVRSSITPGLQYRDGMNLYSYVQGRPSVDLDPDGYGVYKVGVFNHPRPIVVDILMQQFDQSWGRDKDKFSSFEKRGYWLQVEKIRAAAWWYGEDMKHSTESRISKENREQMRA